MACQTLQQEDLLKAWRELSGPISLPPDGLDAQPRQDSLSLCEPDAELARLTCAQLAASPSAEHTPEQASLAFLTDERSMTDAQSAAAWDAYPEGFSASPLLEEFQESYYAGTAAMWDASESPQVLMGSPEQLPRSFPLRPTQCEYPEQLPHDYGWYPTLEGSALRAHSAAQSASPMLASTWHPASMAEQLSEHLRPCEAYQGSGSAASGPPSEAEPGRGEVDSEQWLGQPSEEDLYAMLARFQESCSRVPSVLSASSDDLLAASSSPDRQPQPAQQEPAASSESLEHSCQQSQERTQAYTPEHPGMAQDETLPELAQADMDSTVHPSEAHTSETIAKIGSVDSGADDDIDVSQSRAYEDAEASVGMLETTSMPAALTPGKDEMLQQCCSSSSSSVPAAEEALQGDDMQPPAAASQLTPEDRKAMLMYSDTLQPEEAPQLPLPLEEALLHMARLPTCSDDEEFAVLDLGAGSDSSSDCSFGGGRTAAVEQGIVYPAPR